MPRLVLQFDDLLLNEYPLGLSVTIGRLPDNTVVINNPAVSSHHACVFRDGDQYIVEDLQSTNGTFVNDKRVTRQPLQNGDVVLIGKHKLVFDERAAEEAAADDEPARPIIENLGDTVYLDTKKHRALLAQLEDVQEPGNGLAAGSSSGGKTAVLAASPARVGTLRVLVGRTDQPEYKLEARTSLIGSSDTALIRLKGWFKPKAAVAIARHGEGYVATLLGGKTLINNEPVSGRYDLKDGDVLSVSGLILEFRLRQ